VEHRNQLAVDAIADPGRLAVFELGWQKLRRLLHFESPLGLPVFRRATRYSVVTMTATLSALKPRILTRPEIRLGPVVVTLVLTVGLIVAATRLGAVVPAGADLADPTQRSYAQNIWQETQTSLALLAVFLPWLVYGLVFRGSRWGGVILLAVATLGTLAGTWLTDLSLQSYAGLPRLITGVVARVDGRQLSLTDGPAAYLVISDAQLAAARPWLKVGTPVTLWVSPRGHAGYLGRAPSAD
jgi:hypothetical protein